MNERWYNPYKAAMQPSPVRAAVRGHAQQRVLAVGPALHRERRLLRAGVDLPPKGRGCASARGC